MPDFNLVAVRTVLKEFVPQGRTALLPALHAAQRIHGYIPEPVAAEVGALLHVPLAEIYGVIDFYTHFFREPVGATVVHICNDPVCANAGAGAVMKSMLRRVHPGESVSLDFSPCLGLCEHAPALIVRERQRGRVNPALNAGSDAGWDAEIDETIGYKPYGVIGGDVFLLTGNCGKGQAASLESYKAAGGYQALQSALGRTPAEVIAEVKAAGLVGRGGAAFPTGAKWEAAAQAAEEPKYVVCNGDEAEPGAFKDRVLMEEDPHRVLEGLVIAAYAVGAHAGYIFIRAEYPGALQAMAQAVGDARAGGCLGANILGTGFDFDVELRRGAGAYICGEETALFEAIEGKRGFPRVKPPFPTTHGLFGKPTAINNVETLCNVPLILAQGAARYRQLGTEQSPGPKLFCVSGDVGRPGLYEVPFGVTLRHLIYDLAGGIRGGKRPEAILLGGAAGAFAAERNLDVRLSFEDLRAAGLPLGAGVVTVFNETRDLRDVLLRLARFFADESCGKCYPCQLGTQRQYEILQRVAKGEIRSGDGHRLQDVGRAMTDASLCGLGQTAASAVLSALKLWPNLME